jgi:hypothetical protein
MKMLIGRALRAGAAGLSLLLIGTTGHTVERTQMSIPSARIDAPADGAQVDGVVEIRGRATVTASGQFAFYRLLIGIGRTPSIMRPLGPPYDRPVENGVLATWDTDRFPSDEYLLTLQVYADDDSYESASVAVTVKNKPTPTPLPLSMPNPIGVPPAIGAPVPAAAPVPNEPSQSLVAPIAPVDGAPPVEPSLMPIPTIGSAGETIPIQPIPFDPDDPGPFAVDTPTTFSPSQLPGDPAPVYVTN